MDIRPAILEDAILLFEWRNDRLTREASINSDSVPLESHMDWLRSSLANPNRKLLIAETDRPVGTVRIDYSDETELTWMVAPDARGLGIGKAMLSAAIPEGPVIARIKSGNVASQRLAASVGFQLLSDGVLQKWKRNSTFGT